jgi:alpha,alpha-trehalose phosphorylase
LAAVAGFGGLRDHTGEMAFAPTLPDALDRIAFHIVYRDRRLRVEILPEAARSELLSGNSIELIHHGQRFTLHADEPVVLPWSPVPPDGVVSPPRGRSPLQRGVGADSDAPVHGSTG